MNNIKVIVLLSGGLDSAVALALARQKKYRIKLALTFDYGQKAARQEIAAARRLCREYRVNHQVISLHWLGRLANNALTNKSIALKNVSRASKKSAQAVWIPNRNALFINIAAAYAEANGWNEIITGFNKEEARSFPDNSIAFINSINRSLRYSTLKHIKVTSFTARLNKKQIISAAKRLGLDIAQLWSCYEGGKTPCGKCESCKHRAE